MNGIFEAHHHHPTDSHIYCHTERMADLCLGLRILAIDDAKTSQKITFLGIWHICNSAGTSPTFWTRGLVALGLAGTRGLAGPIEDNFLDDNHKAVLVTTVLVTR